MPSSRRGSDLRARHGLFGLRVAHGQRELKRGADAFLAVDPDLATVTLHDLLGDVQAQTETSIVRRRHLPTAVKALEYLVQLIDRDPDSTVSDRRSALIPFILPGNQDFPAFSRVLHTVLPQLAHRRGHWLGRGDPCGW